MPMKDANELKMLRASEAYHLAMAEYYRAICEEDKRWRDAAAHAYPQTPHWLMEQFNAESVYGKKD